MRRRAALRRALGALGLAAAAALSAAEVGSDGAAALREAVYREDLAAARRLLAAGVAPDDADRYGVAPLSLACLNGDAATVRLLLEAGADPNSSRPGGETALMTASRTGVVEAVRLLLKAGADPNRAEEREGQTALMWAAAEGHAEVARALLDAGAERDARLDSGFTAFLFAARQGHIETLRALLDAGADPNETIRPTPRPGRRDGSGGRPRTGSSALLLAALNAHYEAAALLLDRGADPNAAEPGYTVLHALPSIRDPGVGDNDPPPEGSGAMTSLEFVRKLAAAGADLDARMTQRARLGNTILNTLGATPFLLAAHAADLELMRTLVELGADRTLTNADGGTPLMAAAGVGTRSPGEDAGTEEEVAAALEQLLEWGADPNAVDAQGETAMHGAAYKNAPAAIRVLAAAGADPEVWNRPNQQGWTPLTIAKGTRFGNFKPSPPTVQALEELLKNSPQAE